MARKGTPPTTTGAGTGTYSVGSPIASARFRYRNMVEEALRPIAPVRTFADMTPEEQAAIRAQYERKP
jgi:hypothetical protein